MKTIKNFWIIFALALPLLILLSCKNNDKPIPDVPDVPEIPEEPEIPTDPTVDFTQFAIVNNGNGAVETIDPTDDTPLEIVQTIPSFGGGAMFSTMFKSSSARSATARPSAKMRAATADSPIFPANLPIMFFFNNKLYLNSIKDNVEIIVDGEKVFGTISINEAASGYAILTFIPWKEFTVNKSISVTVKKDIQSKGGQGMYSDVNLIYQTTQGASGSFDGNGGFEKGDDGVVFIGDGSRMKTTGPLAPQEGLWYAAVSSGDYLCSESGSAIGGTTSMMILGPINKEITSLNFYYDFISAEFNEWVDSEYDDCAMFTISGPKGSYSEFITSVNTIRFDNDPFVGFPGMPDDGDDYAGHIGWTKREINFTKVGTPAYITFTVTDVSDEIYSSILAVDNIIY